MALELNPDAVFLLGIAGTGCRIRRDDHEGGKTRQDRQQRAGFPTRDDGESRWRAVAIAAFFLMMGVTLVVPPTDAAVVAPLAAD
jgi:hypothetical protein